MSTSINQLLYPTSPDETPSSNAVAPSSRAASVEPPDYTQHFNTILTPEQEAQFQRVMGDRVGDLYDYDLRGAWLANAQATANGHLPDTWKKPNHPTFSDQSRYSNDQMPGGTWTQAANGQWTYAPTPHVLSTFGLENLQRYFRAREPDSVLRLGQ